MPKAIKSDARSFILKVISFFEEEARAKSPIIPFKQIYKRISAATGVSQGLISTSYLQHCKHVHKLEEEYLKQDSYLDKPFIIEVRSDTETESDSDDDDGCMEIGGIFPHSLDEVGRAGCSKDHNYCKPGFNK